jgi:heptosyltransferase-2
MTAETHQIQPQTVLVACPNWVGDVVMATPTFECIRQSFPEARLIGLIRRYARGVVEDGPWFNDLIEINDKTIGGFINLVRQLRRFEPDLAIILPNSFRSAMVARLGRAKKIIGYRRNGRSALMTGGPAPRRNNNRITPRPMVEYYMEICRWLNLDTPWPVKPRLFCSDTTRQQGARLIESYGIAPDDMVIGMNPGARFGSSKCWPIEHFARLAEMISSRWDCRIMLFTGPGEQDLGHQIAKLSQTEIINTGPDNVNLALLKPLIQRCRLLVTNDTGPRHYAVAYDIPVVVIMGPTDPRYTNANLEKTIVLRRELECSPCHHKECGLNHSCMADISPEAVLEAVKRLLQEHSRP